MEPLWTPWRMPYILAIKESTTCVFCHEVMADGVDPDLVIHRGEAAFVVLNLYPYATGHLMVIPYRHVAALGDLTAEELSETVSLLQRAERVLSDEVGAREHVVGLNLGRCAGAGVQGHLHVHVVPRGPGGTAPSTPAEGEPPEPLPVTRDRLARAWQRSASGAPAHSANS